MMDDAQPDQIILRPTENPECEQQEESISGSEDEEENNAEEPEENEIKNQKKMKIKTKL